MSKQSIRPIAWMTVVVSLIGAFGGVNALHGSEPAAWEPHKTRVFIVSLARFSGDRLPSFSPQDRLDDGFVDLFKNRGVPASQILFLKDEQATTKNIKSQFEDFLRHSKPDETLFFYFGSHGDYDPETAQYDYCTFNGTLSFDWTFNSIEHNFKGSHAILTTDCCHSGGIVELLGKRNPKIAYACLSSTYAHQTAWSGWRFMQCLHRGFAGNPVVDLDGDGQVRLDELAAYSAKYMSFAAEGKPTFATTRGFGPKLCLSAVHGKKKPRVGELLEARSGPAWAKAEVIGSADQKLKVHFTDDTRTLNDCWLAASQLRPFHFRSFPKQAAVEVLSTSDDNWHPALVLDTWDSLAFCRYDRLSPAYDEWFGPSRLRAALAGNWTGVWRNSLDESGDDSLVIQTGKDDAITGTWSGNIPFQGERIGKDAFYFEGSTANRRYQCAGWLDGPHIELHYIAHRSDSHYFGRANFVRSGASLQTPPSARVDFARTWTGVYTNSRGGSGDETLTLTESKDRLTGSWSGVPVQGHRLSDTTFHLTGKTASRTYLIIGRVTNHRLTLDYSAHEPGDRYSGRSTLHAAH